MQGKKTSAFNSRFRSLCLVAMMVLTSLSLAITTVSAVGQNQNDIGTSGGDLPDNLTSPTTIPNLVFSNSISGTGELVSGTDTYDYLRVSLASNEGIAVELSFDSADDFDLYLYDSAQSIIDDSWISNPETVTTNGSSTGGMVYIEIYAYSFGPTSTGTYNLTIWKFTTGSSTNGTTNQNDIGITNYDLPDSTNLLQTDPYWPVNFVGAAPIYSGVDNAELDLNGDNEDWLSFTLDVNDGFAFEISYSSFSLNNGSLLTNDFELAIYDSNMNMLDLSAGNNPEYVTTNNTATIPGGSVHGGTIYVQINRYSGYGVYDLEFWVWSTTSTGGGTGSNGIAVPSPCVGNNAVPDILEPNDDATTATLASILPIYCTGLSVDIDAAGNANEDYYEIEMITGVTYYFNLTFSHSGGDIDARLEDSSSSTISFNNFGSMGSSSDNEAAEYTANSNFTAYFVVYHFSSFGSTGAISNNYDVEISTDNPGGGQTFQEIDVVMNNLTNITLEMSGLIVGDTYEYDYFQSFENGINSSITNQLTQGPYTFVATSITETANYTITAGSIEGAYSVTANLYDSQGIDLASGDDFIYLERLVVATTSSTTGEIYASNMTTGDQYSIHWITIDIDMFEDLVIAGQNITDAFNSSLVDENFTNFTATSNTDSWQVNWSNPTTANNHTFYAAVSQLGTQTDLFTGVGYLGAHEDEFIPQLPSAVITNYSFSVTATNNDFTSEGLDLVVGQTYYQQFRVEDSGGADIDYSTVDAYTANTQNTSFGTFYYTTPSVSGQYCLYSELYDVNMIQLVGDYVCLQYVFDDDNDGIPNEYDLCPNTQISSMVDANGCALEQKDSDSDGYNDSVDDFPYDDTQWLDTDGDGFGDSLTGNNPDLFPTDSTQWSDIDGDGYGDNAAGNSPDQFPYDPTQWHDSDGDGYGDNANGNNPDLWPNDSSQWTDSDGDGYGDNPTGTAGDAFPFDSTQWTDTDGDGFGDNPIPANNPDAFPNDGTQWEDADGDGYGDNQGGSNADRFVNDPTQWFDSDNDGYGNNPAPANNPDAFPNDGTQWLDTDQDGYGDNQNGNNPDKFPTDNTQWQDSDYDGLGDNANGNNPDLCPGTPFGETVDVNGCSSSQTDEDQDMIPDNQDACPNTPAGEFVDSNGCSATQLDDDNDGLVNQYDLCPATPLGSVIDSAGCSASQLDTDDDGINDELDQCPSTSPNVPINGFGCAADQRDTDMDGLNDNVDSCPNTPTSETANNNGCSPSQTDTDLDGVFDNQDLCANTILTDMDGDGDFDVDSVGCSPIQYDDDNDMIDNTIDICPATPNGEQTDSVGCSDSQLDEDMDDIWNSDDLCFDTPAGESVDQNGCSEYQKDDDQDGYVNAEDDCRNTPLNNITDGNGCSLIQLDSDGDGVNDFFDAFPFDRNESVDTDGDGITDRLDAYPLDDTKSEAEVEDGGGGFMYIALAILIIGVIGALLVVRNKQEGAYQSPFSQATNTDDLTETNMNQDNYQTKEIPQISEQQNQTWEENGVHWSVDENGQLSYFDDGTQSWQLFQQ